jgi:hypothetical protein
MAPSSQSVEPPQNPGRFNTLVYFDAAAETDAGNGAGMILLVTLMGVTGATALVTGDLVSV